MKDRIIAYDEDDDEGAADATPTAATGDTVRADESSDERAAVQEAEHSVGDGAAAGETGIADEDALVLTTVAVPYGDRLTTYDAAGSGVIWRVPATLAAKVGNGALPRREAGEGATAQCLVVDQQRFVLRGLDDDEWPVTMIDEATLPVPPNEFHERIRLMLIAAARRGEAVVFARPGQVEMGPPCVRASVVRDESDVWLSVVEAFPAVILAGWADAEVEEGVSRQTALADEKNMIGAAMLMLMAAQTFAPGPEQIGLYFEKAPDGPWVDD